MPLETTTRQKSWSKVSNFFYNSMVTQIRKVEGMGVTPLRGIYANRATYKGKAI